MTPLSSSEIFHVSWLIVSVMAIAGLIATSIGIYYFRKFNNGEKDFMGIPFSMRFAFVMLNGIALLTFALILGFMKMHSLN